MSADNSSTEDSTREHTQPLSLASPTRPQKKRVGFSVSHSTAHSPPLRSGSHDNAIDGDELRRELTKAISNGDIERERQLAEEGHMLRPDSGPASPDGYLSQPEIVISEPGSPAPGTPGTPRTIRPALRRNTSYDVPREREEADRMEEQTSPRQRMSLTSARHRANQLAVSLEPSRSAPGSRRNSLEIQASFQSALHAPQDEDQDAQSSGPPSPVLGASHGIHNASPSPRTSSPHRPQPRQPVLQQPVPRQSLRSRLFRRRRVHDPDDDDDQDVQDERVSRYARTADRLVNFHSRRSRRDLYQDRMRERSHSRGPSPEFKSGASTPITHDQQSLADDDEDWVPRPERYRGNVIGSLLSLYHAERRGDSAASTPDASPNSSRPSSRSTSPVRGWRKSQGSNALGQNSAASSTLSLPDLGKGLSGSFIEKIKRHRSSFTSSRGRKEHARITNHIAEIIFRHRYLMKLCRALIQFGAPSHRLEDYMRMTARVLEIEAQFLYLPGCMFISLDDQSTHTTEVKIVRAPHGVDFDRLSDVHDIYKTVVHDKISVIDASHQLEAVMKRKPKFNVATRIFLFGIASCCVAPFGFQGNWRDMGPAFLLGSIVGFLQLQVAPKLPMYGQVFEVVSAIVTSCLARAFGAIRYGDGRMFCFSALAQSSIALILPGWFVLNAALELQSGNMISGSVRMVWALIYTLFLGYGTTIGATLYGTIDRNNAPSEVVCEAPLDDKLYPIFVVGFTCCLALVNNAKFKQLPVMCVISLAAYCVNSYSKPSFSGQATMSVMLGALTVGILANLYSRLGSKVANKWLDFVEWIEDGQVGKTFSRLKRTSPWGKPKPAQKESPRDPESRPASPSMMAEHKELAKPEKRRRRTGYSLAAAAMLPAIFVQVPSGLASSGFLFAGVQDANAINNDHSSQSAPPAVGDGTPFSFLYNVIQIAIGISVGLFMSALIVYPVGKRRSGLFSF